MPYEFSQHPPAPRHQTKPSRSPHTPGARPATVLTNFDARTEPVHPANPGSNLRTPARFLQGPRQRKEAPILSLTHAYSSQRTPEYPGADLPKDAQTAPASANLPTQRDRK